MKVGEKTNFGRLATIFHICSMDADILSYISDICLDGYVFHHVPRLHNTGGGVSVVLKNNIKAKI